MKLNKFFASLVAMFVLALAFTAFSPVETSAKNSLNVFKPAQSILAQRDSTCTVSGYILDPYTGQPIANRFVQHSGDGGQSWQIFANTDSNGYYYNSLPATGQTFWQIRVMPTKGEAYQVSYGRQAGSEVYLTYCTSYGEDIYIHWNEYPNI